MEVTVCPQSGSIGFVSFRKSLCRLAELCLAAGASIPCHGVEFPDAPDLCLIGRRAAFNAPWMPPACTMPAILAG